MFDFVLNQDNFYTQFGILPDLRHKEEYYLPSGTAHLCNIRNPPQWRSDRNGEQNARAYQDCYHTNLC